MVERDGSAKGIVFSQFTSFLDLINYSLIKVILYSAHVSYLHAPESFSFVNAMNLLQSCVDCVQLVGTMSLAARDAAIKKFTEDSNCRIFLMSLKAGGVALNLSVATHVSYNSTENCKLRLHLVCWQ